MKKLFLSLMAMMLTILMSHTMVSCDSSESELDEVTNADIVGTWILKEAAGEKYNDNNHYVVFKEDQTYEVFPKGNPFGFRDTGTWAVSTYHDEGFYLTLNYNANYEIISITRNTLTIVVGKEEMKFQRKSGDSSKDDNTSATTGGNGGSSSTSKLVGKWLERKYEWVGEGTKTFTGSNRYLQINSDMTFTVNPYNLFEAEFRDGPFTWSVQSNILVLSDKYGKTMYRILSNTSTTLQLGWLDEGTVVEKVTFEKAK